MLKRKPRRCGLTCVLRLPVILFEERSARCRLQPGRCGCDPGDRRRAAGLDAAAPGLAARVTTGLGIKFASGGMVALGAEYGGIGGNLETWTYKAKGQVPF
jgi:hypothetical protein